MQDLIDWLTELRGWQKAILIGLVWGAVMLPIRMSADNVQWSVDGAILEMVVYVLTALFWWGVVRLWWLVTRRNA